MSEEKTGPSPSWNPYAPPGQGKQEPPPSLEELLRDALAAIDSHPKRTVDVYRKGVIDLWRNLAADGKEEELESLAAQYQMAMAFIGAWYHVMGDEEKRNEAAHTTATILAGPQGDQETAVAAFEAHMTLELEWRRRLREAGVRKRNVLGYLVAALILALVVYLIIVIAQGN